jgi:hypothetical protein
VLAAREQNWEPARAGGPTPLPGSVGRQVQPATRSRDQQAETRHRYALMALYEIVLCRPDRDDEIRFTDQEPTIGSTLLIDYRAWAVERLADSDHPIARTRYICVARDRRE